MSRLSCPRCLNGELDPAQGPRGIPINACPACGGVWLDKSEIYAYTSEPRKLFDVIAAAFKTPSASRFLCRRCDVQMAEVDFPKPGPAIDVCRKCGGSWFDKGEIEALLALAGAPKTP